MTRDFPFEVGDMVFTPDLIGGVTGILIEVEKLADPLEQWFKGKVTHHRTHRIKLAIVHTQSRTWKPGELADFWPCRSAEWKKL